MCGLLCQIIAHVIADQERSLCKQNDIMHFTTGGVILLFAGVWAAPEGRGRQRTRTRSEESTLEQLRKLEENYMVVGRWANKAVEEIKREQKAKALALNSEKCESVIRSCAVV